MASLPSKSGFRVVHHKGAWETSNMYAVGDVVTHNGYRLVCTRGHYAGHAATDPWDPGSGWCPDAKLSLWHVLSWWQRGPLIGFVKAWHWRPTVESGAHGMQDATGWPNPPAFKVAPIREASPRATGPHVR